MNALYVVDSLSTWVFEIHFFFLPNRSHLKYHIQNALYILFLCLQGALLMELADTNVLIAAFWNVF